MTDENLPLTRVPRPSIYAWAMEIAHVVKKRGTCFRRQVGCVLLDDRGHILATGYNGPSRGSPHCGDHRLPSHVCSGALAPSGTRLDECQAIHAEQNALLQCQNVQAIKTAVVTTSPCMTCTKLLMNTSCEAIIYDEEYPGSDWCRDLWERSLFEGRKWSRLKSSS